MQGPIVFREDAAVGGVIAGSAMVLAGARLTLDGTITGNLVVEIDGRAVVRGTGGGAIRNRGGHVHLSGIAADVVDVAGGAVSIIEAEALVGSRQS